MLADVPAFSGFSVDDPERVLPFYRDVLGLRVELADGMLRLHLGGGTDVLVYPKGGAHAPGSYTVLNFPVRDVAATVGALRERGVAFERYAGTAVETDEDFVFRGGGPLIAWFTDPAGNTLSVIEA
ncbi:VOC family protein [Cellulomonas endophytica]|uniref:VOC family protein n=1 Tax=Cellulomonas endophytica TaxID=2494735 RepID=UPI0010121705|nr:VOC family protein [Cellulomonas endophytica]